MSAVTGPFHRTTLWVVVGVAAVSLVAAAALSLFGDDLGGGTPSAGADTYSRSAIGHRGLVELLRRLDVPVVQSRHASAAKARHGLLVVAEPAVPDAPARERLQATLAAARRALVVLPKWYGHARPGAPWVEEVGRVARRDVDDVLDALPRDGSTLRSAPPELGAPWLAGVPPPKLAAPQLAAPWSGLVPDSADPLDVPVDLPYFLAAWTWPDGRELWVLSDPDALNNHGLRTPENARFAVALIDRLRGDGPVVFDETSHGYAQPPGLARTLLRFPIVLATLHVLACALVAIWAAMVRFGPRRAAPPPLAPGKDFLIQNTAALLHYGGHHGHALRRYLAQSIAAVRRALHAPELGPTATLAWLDGIGRARGVAESLETLERDAQLADTPHRALEVADRVHRWRMEMTHGAIDRP